jgi:hypothetical protein
MTTTRKNIAWLTLFTAILMALIALLAVYGYREHWWTLITGFRMAGAALYVGIAAAIVALLAIVLPPYRRPLLPRIAAGLAVLIALGAAWPGIVEYRTPIAASRVYDISSDVGNPPVFMDLIKVRGDVTNSADYGGFEFARAQEKYYPDIKPVRLSVPPADAFAKAAALAKQMGWQIVAEVADQGRIEAVATTRWFQIQDDVVVRIQWVDNGSKVDIRSKSRIARNNYGPMLSATPIGDRGENARRVREFLRRLAG